MTAGPLSSAPDRSVVYRGRCACGLIYRVLAPRALEGLERVLCCPSCADTVLLVPTSP